MKSSIFRAAVIALVLGGLLPLAYSSVNCESFTYPNGRDLAEFYSLPYEQQKEWLRDNQIRITGMTCFRQRVQSWQYWREYLAVAAIAIGLLFSACLLMVRWERVATRSHATAKKSSD